MSDKVLTCCEAIEAMVGRKIAELPMKCGDLKHAGPHISACPFYEKDTPDVLTVEERDRYAECPVFVRAIIDRLAGRVQMLERDIKALDTTRSRSKREGLLRAAEIAENVTGGYTAAIRTSETEQEFLRDPDGPWVLNSHVAEAIRAAANEAEPCRVCGCSRHPHEAYPEEKSQSGDHFCQLCEDEAEGGSRDLSD